MRNKPTRQKRSFRILAILLLISSAYLAYLTWNRSVTPTDFKGLRELSGSFQSHGIDISRYQGNVDWDLFFEQGDSVIGFVYCKATEGLTHVDKKWKKNEKALRSRNKIFGAYHFFIPTLNAEHQAEHFLNHYFPQQNDLPPVIDIETEAQSDKVLIERVGQWLEIVEDKTGKRPVIYTSYHFYSTKLKNAFPDHKFWIANYSNKEDRLADKNIIHWQYSDKGRVPGIRGPVDLNVSKIDYRN